MEECMKIYHVPVDLSHVTELKTVLDEVDVDNVKLHERDTTANSQLVASQMQELKQKIQVHERQKYEDVLKENLVALLESLDIEDAEDFIDSQPSMEEVALEIKHCLSPETKKSPHSSSRLLKKDSHYQMPDDTEELNRENRRLKELVVKLQYEITENFKKNSDVRIKELYEDNQNLQRKIADLIDQLKRKEQEILLIPVGKVAQNKIDGLSAEKNELQKQLDELKKKYDTDIQMLKDKLLTSSGNKHPFTPNNSRDIHIDISMLQTIREQKNTISHLSELLQNVRQERDLLEQRLVEVQESKHMHEVHSSLLQSFLTSEGVDTQELLHELTSRDVDSKYNGNTHESDAIEELRMLHSKIKKIKEDVNKSTVDE